MAMTAQQYILAFQLEGVQNLNVAALGLNKVDLASLNLGKSFEKNLVLGAKSAGFAIKDLGSLLGTRLVSQFAEVNKSGDKTGKIFKLLQVAAAGTNGEIRKMEILLSKVKGGQWQLAKNGVQSIGEFAPNSLNRIVPQQTPSFLQRLNPLGDTSIDVAGLIKRAAVTIPVWAAMRVAMESVTNAIPSAIDRFRELDGAIATMKILTDGADKFENFSERVGTALNKLSQDTGKTMTDLQKIYTAISSTGIDAETSLSAMDTIAKGALATGAEPELLAKTMAGLVNTMGDTLEVGQTKGEKFQELMAYLHSAMKTNAGSMNDFAEALGQAGATAAVTGMKLTELVANVAVLQTAMVRAGMGGTALRTALDQVVQKRQEVVNFLDGELTPEQGKNQFTVIMAIVEKMRALANDGKLNEVDRIMTNIFGVKAGKNINVLRQNLDKFKDTIGEIMRLQAIGDTQGVVAMMQNLEKDFGTAMNTLIRQQERWTQVSSEANRMFLAGIFGVEGKDAIEVLTNLNDALQKSGDSFKNFGLAVKEIAFASMFGAASLGIQALVGSLGGIGPALVAAGLAIKTFMLDPRVLLFMTAAAAAFSIPKLLEATKVDASTPTGLEDRFAQAGEKGQRFTEALDEIVPDLSKKLREDFKDKQFKGYTGSFEGYAQSTMIDYGSPLYSAWRDKVSGKGVDGTKVSTVLSVEEKAAADAKAGEDTKQREALYKAEATQLLKMKLLGASNLDIKYKELEAINRIFLLDEKREKSAEKLREINQEILEMQVKWASETQKTMKDSIMNNFQGKDGSFVQDFGKNQVNQFQDVTAGGLAKMLMGGGINGGQITALTQLQDLFGANQDPVVEAIEKSNSLLKSIDMKIVVGDGEGLTTATSDIINLNGGTNLNALSTISGTAQFGGSTAMKKAVGNWMNRPMNSQAKQNPATGKWELPGGGDPGRTRGDVAGYAMGITGAAMTGYEGMQQIKGGGAKNVMSGLGTVAFAASSAAFMTGWMAATSATAKAGAGNSWNIVGWVLLIIAALMLVASLFMKGQKQVQTQSQTQESKIASKIDISNKSLEIINRNLVDLKTAITAFVLPNSAYYGTKRNVEDLWSLSARRGLLV